MTGRDRIILQKTINYASDAVQYISGMDFEQFMPDSCLYYSFALRYLSSWYLPMSPHNVNFSAILQEALKEYLGVQTNQK